MHRACIWATQIMHQINFRSSNHFRSLLCIYSSYLSFKFKFKKLKTHVLQGVEYHDLTSKSCWQSFMSSKKRLQYQTLSICLTSAGIWILATYDIVCHLRYRMSGHTISYVRCWMSYTISYVRYRIYDIALLDIRYRMYDIVCFYDIVCQHAMSYV